MDKRFEKRLALAMNPRARKRHCKVSSRFVRPSSSLAVLLDELQHPIEGTRKDVSPLDLLFPSNAEVIRMGTMPAKIVGEIAFATAMDGVDTLKKCLGKKDRMRKLEKRRSYYAAAEMRRAEQREQIRAARPAPSNPCPSPEALEFAYLHRRDSDESLQCFGQLMIDLEEHVQREYAFSGNKFAGSSGGVKDWLKEKCPFLAAHYSTCQRYKRLAQEDYATQVNV